MGGTKGLPANHGLLDEILQSVQAARLVAAVLPLDGISQVLQVVQGFFGVAEKLPRANKVVQSDTK